MHSYIPTSSISPLSSVSLADGQTAALYNDPVVWDPSSESEDQCCGSVMFIPDPWSDFFFHPGSVPKKLSILTQKNRAVWIMIWVVHPESDPGSGSSLLAIPDPGSGGQKGHRIPDPDPQHCGRLSFAMVSTIQSLRLSLNACFYFDEIFSVQMQIEAQRGL